MSDDILASVAALKMELTSKSALRPLILFAALIGLAASVQHPIPAQKTIVRKIDHIVILAQDAGALFRLFSETFQWPIAWPLQSYGSFSSGGVSAGNVNLEFVVMEKLERSRLHGISFEPESFGDLVEDLDSRGIDHGTPQPFRRADSAGGHRLLWTNLRLRGLPGAPSAFVSKYHFFDVEARRLEKQRELAARRGGPLGIESVREVVIGVTDVDDAAHRWQRLFDPVKPAERGLWRLGAGPAVRLVATEANGIQSLVLKTASLARAKDFLSREKMLGAVVPGQIAILPETVQGLDLRLVE